MAQGASRGEMFCDDPNAIGIEPQSVQTRSVQSLMDLNQYYQTMHCETHWCNLRFAKKIYI